MGKKIKAADARPALTVSKVEAERMVERRTRELQLELEAERQLTAGLRDLSEQLQDQLAALRAHVAEKEARLRAEFSAIQRSLDQMSSSHRNAVAALVEAANLAKSAYGHLDTLRAEIDREPGGEGCDGAQQ